MPLLPLADIDSYWWYAADTLSLIGHYVATMQRHAMLMPPLLISLPLSLMLITPLAAAMIRHTPLLSLRHAYFSDFFFFFTLLSFSPLTYLYFLIIYFLLAYASHGFSVAIAALLIILIRHYAYAWYYFAIDAIADIHWYTLMAIGHWYYVGRPHADTLLLLIVIDWLLYYWYAIKPLILILRHSLRWLLPLSLLQYILLAIAFRHYIRFIDIASSLLILSLLLSGFLHVIVITPLLYAFFTWCCHTSTFLAITSWCIVIDGYFFISFFFHINSHYWLLLLRHWYCSLVAVFSSHTHWWLLRHLLILLISLILIIGFRRAHTLRHYYFSYTLLLLSFLRRRLLPLRRFHFFFLSSLYADTADAIDYHITPPLILISPFRFSDATALIFRHCSIDIIIFQFLRHTISRLYFSMAAGWYH